MNRSACLAACLAAVVWIASSRDAAGQVVITRPGGDPSMPFPGFNPPNPKTGTGRIRGRVVSADGASAVRRAQIRIMGQDIGTKTALTDAEGRYEFKDLPAGRFTLTATKAGFVQMQYGQSRAYEPGRPIELSDAQQLDKADFTLPRGSVIGGRVVDEFGEPVAEAMVTVMRMQYSGGRRRLMPAGRPGQSNDLGQYRIYGLPPGEYYVSANLRSLDTMMMDMLGGAAAGGPQGSNNSSGYAPTYYPASANPAEAQKVPVALGQELTSVDIALQPVRLARVSGSAMGSDGKQISGAMVMLLPASREAAGFLPGGTGRTNADGRFTLTGVVPGDYTLQLRNLNAMLNEASTALAMSGESRPAGTTPAANPQEQEFASVPITIAGEDITNLVVVTTRGVTASGRVVFEGGVTPQTTGMRILAVSADPDNPAVGGLSGGAVREDGTFEMSGLMGARILRGNNPPKGFRIKSVVYKGADVTDTGIDFKPGEDVNGLELTFSDRQTQVMGAVRDDKGAAVKDCTVVVFSEDPQKWTLPATRWVTSTRPDQDGRYKVQYLPPGTYYAVALEYVATGEQNDPDFLQRNKDRATSFTLTEGESQTLDLKIAR
jgi:Carboxypeptidase regulatory-like domain